LPRPLAAPFQAAAATRLPGEVTATAWLPTCHVISARQCSYPIRPLFGVHLPSKNTKMTSQSSAANKAVAVTSPAKNMAAVA